jgi:hypothetical protein
MTLTPPTIKAVRLIDERLVFELDLEREVSLPLSTSHGLAVATPAERAYWIVGPRGISVHWPAIDEDIAIWEVLGVAEDTYLRWLHEAPVG